MATSIMMTQAAVVTVLTVLPSVQSVYQILSQLTVILYPVMYLLMFGIRTVSPTAAALPDCPPGPATPRDGTGENPGTAGWPADQSAGPARLPLSARCA